MSRIVLHVGPEKCGSSTIQRAVMNPPPELTDLLRGLNLAPGQLAELDSDHVAAPAAEHFHSLIEGAQAANPDRLLVLSHEMIFKNVQVLAHLARIATEHADEVVVIAYARRQSDFLVSCFGQWLFRSPERIAETAAVLRSHELDPELFRGVERHLIAALLDDWTVGRQLSGHLYFDWSRSVPERSAALAPLNVPLSIGLLPRAGFDFSLLPDFLARAGIDARLGAEPEVIENRAYHPSILDGVLTAIEAGYSMPGPHAANDFFKACSAAAGPPLDFEGMFISRLKAHVDTAFEPKNAKFAAESGLPAAYFTPTDHVDFDTISGEILAEAATRAALPDELRERARADRAALTQMAWASFQRRG